MVTIKLKKFTNTTQVSNMTFENVSQAAKALGVANQTIAKSERGMMTRYDSYSEGNGYAFNGYYEGVRYICETISGSLHYSITYSVKKNKKQKSEYHSGVALRTGEDVTSFSNVGRGSKLIPCTLKDANTGLDHPFDALVDATSRVYALNNSAKKVVCAGNVVVNRVSLSAGILHAIRGSTLLSEVNNGVGLFLFQHLDDFRIILGQIKELKSHILTRNSIPYSASLFDCGYGSQRVAAKLDVDFTARQVIDDNYFMSLITEVK